jgi:hypothetical protein
MKKPRFRPTVRQAEGAMNAIRHEIETTYINEWVEMGAYELVVNVATAQEMRRQRVDLVDINYVLRTGTVVQSDMLDSRGLWDVLGGTVDGDLLELQIAVVSSECEVELLRIVKMKRRRK